MMAERRNGETRFDTARHQTAITGRMRRSGDSRSADPGRSAPPGRMTDEPETDARGPDPCCTGSRSAAGAGLFPQAPGTAGTVVAIPIYLVFGTAPLAVYALGIVCVIGVGIWVCGRTARDLGVHDHPGIVLDEIAGFLVTMTALPLEWPWIVAASWRSGSWTSPSRGRSRWPTARSGEVSGSCSTT